MKDKAKKTTNTKDTGKIFDVTRPGKATVSATSRPVIVGHKPQVKDPMMAKHDNDEQSLLDSTQKVTVQPTPSIAAEKPATEVDAQPSPAGAPPVPTDLEAATTAEPTPRLNTPLDDETDGPTIASVAVTGAVEKPMSEPSAPELEPELAAQIEPDDKPTDAVPVSTTPFGELPPNPEPAPASNTEPEAVPSPGPTTPNPTPEKSNGTMGVVFEEPANAHQPKEIAEDVDPLPVLPDEPTPQSIIVSHHKPKASVGKVFLTILLILIFAVIVLDVLLDAGFIVIDSIPHTDFF